MATREENLKKINEELEKLDDEQLENIAGGLHPIFVPRKSNKAIDTDPAAYQTIEKNIPQHYYHHHQ